MIPQNDIDRILEATRIEEVIEDFVPLKKRGASFVACCPFHDEKTPSFHVTPSKGIFKCFGCGKAGDAVTFLKEYNHLSYVESLRWLARKYGIQIHEKELTPEEIKQRDEKEELYNINEFAQKYFYNNLLNTQEGQSIGLSYFIEREVTQQTIDTWGLGYCMQKSNDFSLHALRNGYPEELLIKSGLSLKSEKTGELYDRFHSRVTFPIYNVAGRVLGFSARILSSDKTKAKYVNSPETAIYTKGDVLFGLYFAKSEIVKNDLCYLVEGNVDAVMMRQNEVKNVVASSGTALTEKQVKLIKRYTKNVVILYDGDAAGIHATERATDMFLKEGMTVKTLLFPDNDDPDSFARKHTQEEFHNYLKDNTKDFILYKTDRLLTEANNDPIKKSTLVKEVIHSISLIPDLLIRTVYIQQCAALFNMSEQTLTEELSRQISHNIHEERKKNSYTQTPDTTLPPTQTVQQIQQPQQTNPDEQQEKALVKALLMYSDKTTTQMVVSADENGQEIMKLEQVNAAVFILSEIFNDEITINNPLYNKIIAYYYNTVANESRIPKAEELIHSQDSEISSLACDLLANHYTTSPLWQNKYNVHVPLPEDQISIDKDIHDTVYILKYHKINANISELQKSLKDATDEETVATFETIIQLTHIRNRLAKELGIRIG